jgi:peptidoglycan/LPS O-acetylase OafA/YrhL
MPFKLKRLQPSDDIASIEMLRGIASLMVCYFHLSCGNEHFLPAGNIMRRIGSGGYTGWMIFFVISGFIIPYSMYKKKYTIGDFPIFLKKRIIRIEPPYLISIVIVIILNYVSTLSPYYRGSPFSIDWSNVATHFAYLNVFTGKPWLNIVYWTLAIEFQYYILIALAFSLLTSKKVVYRALFFICFALSTFWKLPDQRFIFSYSEYFLAGILLFQGVCKIISSREFWIMMSALIVLIWYKDGIGLTCLIVVSVLAINYINEVPPFLRYLGMISYSLYLLHSPVGGRVINIAEAKIHNIYMREGILIITVFFCILIAVIYYRLVERPCKKLSANIKYNKPAMGHLKKVLSENPL